jgi:hypothetical protein
MKAHCDMKTSCFSGASISAGFAPPLTYRHASCVWPLPALLAVLNLLSAGRATAQTFTTLHSFTG